MSMSPPHDGARAPPPRPSRGHQPSFSAALLDAIYHSLEADADVDVDARSSTETRPAPALPPAERTPVSARHHRPTAAALLSPSRSSVRSPRLQRPPRPCRVRPDPQPNSLLLPPPPPPHDPAAGDCGEKKTRSRRKSRRAAEAKAAPFACLLNALLCNRRSARSVDHTPRATAAAAFPAAAAAEPASARSILSSRASRRESAAAGGILTPARRAVRFSPVAVVVDDGVVGTAAARLRDAAGVEAETVAAQAKESAAEAERRVEELLRALGVAEERERAKESSESSSDLFELESLPAFEDPEMPRPRASGGAGLLALARPRARVV